MRPTHGPIFLTLVVAAVGCSGTPFENTGASSDELVAGTDLPEALGGGGDQSALASSAEPARLHALGLDGPSPTEEPSGTETAATLASAAATGTIDISRWAPHVGDQGQLNDCVSWACGHSSMGWWANRTGKSGAPYNPLFLYSLLNGGSCKTGTTLEAPMDLLKSKGIAPDAAYGHTYCARPTKAQFEAASHHEISGYRSGWPLDQFHECGPPRFPSLCPDDHETSIKNTLSHGPIVIAIQVYNEFENADASHYLVGLPRAGSKYHGNHAVTVMKTDAKGVWIQNQWGTGWGKNGWAELTWAFINSSHTFDAVQITGLR